MTDTTVFLIGVFVMVVVGLILLFIHLYRFQSLDLKRQESLNRLKEVDHWISALKVVSDTAAGMVNAATRNTSQGIGQGIKAVTGYGDENLKPVPNTPPKTAEEMIRDKWSEWNNVSGADLVDPTDYDPFLGEAPSSDRVAVVEPGFNPIPNGEFVPDLDNEIFLMDAGPSEARNLAGEEYGG